MGIALLLLIFYLLTHWNRDLIEMANKVYPTKHSTTATTTSIQAVVELLNSYHELNVDFVDELVDPPSPLQFMRYVAANRPFIVRKGISHWPALSKWNSKYLKKMMGSTSVEVAVTPLGSASHLVLVRHDTSYS